VAAGPGDCEHEGSQRAWLAGIWGVEGSALWVFFERQRKWGFFRKKTLGGGIRSLAAKGVRRAEGV
jgi:hypothetical protein